MAGVTDGCYTCGFQTDKPWLDPQYHKNGTIKKPDELEKQMKDPPEVIDSVILDRIHGSMIGMALGDALGAHVEFRPHKYMVAHPVTDLKGGGTWGLKKGQFTDDTSMALCLVNSLVARRNYVPYDQLVRYKWWYRNGYMSSTGRCFDIGSATKNSLQEFERRQNKFADEHEIPDDQLDFLSDPKLLGTFNVNCSEEGVAGNGALMRLAPVPLFFYQCPNTAVEYSGDSGKITHGDEKAYDACRYYGALIVAAVKGATKKDLVDKKFYKNHQNWFGEKPLHQDIMNIALGSYQKKEGYAKGIRGKGYIVSALEAALWAFWSDKDSFEKGVLAAVNLGDDTDTTAAIYGQLAGACYGYSNLPQEWVDQVYAKDFIGCLSKWIVYEGKNWYVKTQATSNIPDVTVESLSENDSASSRKPETNSGMEPQPTKNQERESKSSEVDQTAQTESVLTSPQSDDPKTSFRPRRNTTDDANFASQSRSYEQQTSYPGSAQKQKPTSSSHQLYFHNDIKTCADVQHWLQSLGDEYVAYADAFYGQGIDGYWLLNQIDDEKLGNCGVNNKDHRKVILYHIGQLREECPKHYVG